MPLLATTTIMGPSCRALYELGLHHGVLDDSCHELRATRELAGLFTSAGLVISSYR